MSRLIDADKLKIRNVSADYWYTVMGITENDIDNAPTVKAIPIEFIERKLAEHWYVDYDIRQLLEDWEKENEV